MGFENISIDFIYGTQTLTDEHWLQNLQQAVDMRIPHISAYNLTIEEKTLLANRIKHRQLEPIDEDKNKRHFELLTQMLTSKGYLHYEISNFAQPQYMAVHNTNYWKGKHYLGVGPSAHSYNGECRSWNVANNSVYITHLNQNKIALATEMLTVQQKVNELLLISLRTMWGCDLKQLASLVNDNAILDQLLKEAEPYVNRGFLRIENDTFYLTEKGKLIADKITSDLMLV